MSVPPGLVVYYRAARYQSHGPPDTLYRTYTDARGVQRTVDLFAPLRSPSPNGSGVQSWAADERMGEIVAASCPTSACGIGVRAIVAGTLLASCVACTDSQARSDMIIHRSRDGGVTWTDAGILPFGQLIVGWYEGEALVLVPNPQPDGQFRPTYRTWPSDTAVQPPLPGLSPRSEVHGAVHWSDHTKVQPWPAYDDHGKLIFAPLPGYEGYQRFAGSAGGRSFAVVYQTVPTSGTLIAELAEDGTVTSLWEAPPFAWLSDLRVVDGRTLIGTAGSIDHTYQSALIELDSYRFFPLPALAEAVANGGRGSGPFIIRVRRLDVLEVTGTGSCLNLRQAPGPTAPIFACYADGVLLALSEADIPTPEWLPVWGPDGIAGWVSAEFALR